MNEANLLDIITRDNDLESRVKVSCTHCIHDEVCGRKESLLRAKKNVMASCVYSLKKQEYGEEIKIDIKCKKYEGGGKK